MSARPRPCRRVSKRRRVEPFPSVTAEGFTRDELDSDDPAEHAPQHAKLHSSFAHLSDSLIPEEPHFEVDDLDSTDDDHFPPNQAATTLAEPQPIGFADVPFASEDEEDDPDFELNPAYALPSPPPSPPPGPLPFNLASFTSEDEEDDPDFDASGAIIHQPQPVQVQEVPKSSDSGPVTPSRDLTYAQFLQALNPSIASSPVPPEAFNQLLDDDDEFDYMREAANVQDDPLEFRNDLLVSRREVAQLLSERDIALRSQRKQRARRSASAAKPPAVPLSLPQNLVPAHAPIVAGGHACAAAPAPMPMRSLPLLPGTIMPLNPLSISHFQEQFKAFVQILAHVHANASKSFRMSDDGQSHQDTKQTLDRSERMLKRVVLNRQLSASYHDMLDKHVMHISRFSDELGYRAFEQCFRKENRRKSAYAIDGFESIEMFMSDCRTLPVEQLPSGAVARLDIVCRPHLKQALSTRKRQFTLTGAREGWFTWTAEDDRLLALTIAKYGREVGEYAKDLLPHRLEGDCQARVRHLSSRRCADNAVKRQVMHISAPLNQQEVALVQYGLQSFGSRVEDCDVWKRIQRELLPGRQWSLLQKLWLWRETRKKTKARYRAKESERKRALRDARKSATAQ
ncbi:hypothetical protein BWQ96_08106 [Gracilariopsis chorda]|uniref:Myb-like domain-containing protein n=1 Tax=Gracilariopsis chorda TaxID=448386 RepID=A0A2V3IJB2_9FLOR|nr:hypothetical protein BWQ96_08106 [Gracilariopsis chorda]|eukprot:PXF42186.1 hypothetical protein BWQ96_08106 [Gracilariopsis chorda]